MSNFKITFFLDGTGVFYDSYEPIHLDSLLVYSLYESQPHNTCFDRDDIPDEIDLPLKITVIHGHKVWHASALFPESDGELFETLRFWRKKFRQNRTDLFSGSPNLQSGVYREYNMPVPLLLIPKLVAYASGDAVQVLKTLKKQIKFLGKKHAYGYGRVVDISFEETEQDYSLQKNGNAMRWLPCPGALRVVRPRPPYWNNHGKTECCEVGDKIDE